MSRAVIFVNGALPNLELVRRLLLPDDILLADEFTQGSRAHPCGQGCFAAHLLLSAMFEQIAHALSRG